MRVEHVVTRSQRRGAEIVAIELADELDALGHEDDAVALALAFDGRVDPRLTPLVHSTSINPLTLVRSGWRLRKRLSSAPADVVIAHGGWSAQVTALSLRGTHHRLVWQRILGIPDRAWHGLRGTYWRWIARQFDAAVVISAELEREMERLAYHGEVWMIPNARNPARFEKVDRAEAGARLRAELGVDEGVVVIGFVGHLIAQKQPELAIEVLDAMRRDGCDAHLVIAGDGPLRASIEQRVSQRGLQSHVTLLGQRDDIELIFGGVDLVVITSASEGVPGVVLEAQMAGCPVVTFPVGSVGDVIDHLETGIVLDSPDVGLMARAAADLLADAPTRLAMGTRARERSAKYSTARTALLYEKHLSNLVHNVRRA